MNQNVGTIYYTVEAETAALLKGVNASDDALNKLESSFGKTDGAAKKTEFQMRKTSEAVQNLGRESQQASSSISNLTKVFGGLLTIQGANALIQMGEGYREMGERIKMATSSQAEYEEVQRRLLATANGTYRSLAEAQEMYIQTSIGLRDMGYATSDSMDIVDSLSYSFVKNSTSADKADSALNGFTRAINRGTVLTDHWASLLIAVPTILEDIASASGMTTQEVSRLGYAGQLSAELLTEGLRKSLEENKAAADGMAVTVRDAMMSVRNSLSAYLGESQTVTSATGLLATSIEFLGNNLETVANILLTLGAGALARYVTQLGLSVIATAKNTTESIKAIAAARAKALEEVKVARAHVASTAAALAQAKANAALGSSHMAVTSAAIRHEAAQRSLAAAQAATTGGARLLVGALGGPAGIVAMLSVAALSFIDFSSKARTSADELDRLTESVNTLSEAQIRLQQMETEDTIESLTEEVEKLRKRLEKASNAHQIFANNSRLSADKVDAAARRVAELSVQLETSESKLQKAITLKGRLADRAYELANGLNTAADAQHGLNAALSGADTAIGKAISRMQGTLTGVLDDTNVKKAERQIQQLRDAGEEFSDADVAALMSAAHAADAATKAKQKTTAATKTGTGATRESIKVEDENKRVIDALNQSLKEASLQGEALAVERAKQGLNKFATAEEVAQVEALAKAIYNVTEIQKARDEFGTGEKADRHILGDTSPLSGGAFDDQYARYEAEAELERQRYADTLERLREARELQIETSRSYDELELQAAQEHADRLNQIEAAKSQTLLSSASDTFGALADVMRQSQGEQSGIYKAMFAASKAFAIAESIVAVQTAIAKASSAGSFPSNLAAMATVASATAGLVSTIASTTMGSGRQYGGPVAPNSMHRINENGKPEILNMANGRQYLLPNSRGEVVSNKDATSGSSAPNVIVNIHNAPEGTEVQGRQVDDEYILDVMIRDVASEGRFTRTGRDMLGWQRQGR